MKTLKSLFKRIRGDRFYQGEVKKLKLEVERLRKDLNSKFDSELESKVTLNNDRLFKWGREGHDRIIREITSKLPENRADFLPEMDIGNLLREEYSKLGFGGFGIQVLLQNFSFDSVLDIGSGSGEHALCFQDHGKHVTSIDYGKSIYFEKKSKTMDTIVADFGDYNFQRTFDCIWACHVLEHQLAPHAFLKKIFNTLSDDGIVAVTVPPLKDLIVGGHVSLWNAGLLLYHLVLAGFDCREAFVCSYGYNISVIVQKKPITETFELAYDNGDIRKISRYLPVDYNYEAFNGNIELIKPGFIKL